MLVTKKLKKFIRGKGYRFSPESVDGINRSVESLIVDMLDNVKQDNCKTLKAKHTAVLKKTEKVETTLTCNRCSNIPTHYIQLAKNLYRDVCDKAWILANKIKDGKVKGVKL